MSIFKKKKKEKRTNFSKVYMPRKTTPPVKTARRKKTTFGPKGKPLKRGKKLLNLEKYKKGFGIFILILFTIGFLFLLLAFIKNLRKQKPVDVITENVVGLTDIPAFPGSQFIFKDDMENRSVSTFISSGNSAYKIPNGKNIEDVYEFYQEQLPERGWEFAISVPIASETMESGEYWIKENSGLRIYTKYHDVWYETITKTEAENGLADRVKQKIDRDLLLANEDAQDLLPDFPWLLKVPREYVITYSVAPYDNMRVLQLKKLGSEENISLTPIDKYHGGGLDYYLDKYIEYKNKGKKDKCGIKKTTVAYTPYSSAVRGEISCNDGLHDIAVIVNPNKGVTYILDSNLMENPYFDEVLKNLKPQDTKRY